MSLYEQLVGTPRSLIQYGVIVKLKNMAFYHAQTLLYYAVNHYTFNGVISNCISVLRKEQEMY